MVQKKSLRLPPQKKQGSPFFKTPDPSKSGQILLYSYPFVFLYVPPFRMMKDRPYHEPSYRTGNLAAGPESATWKSP